MSAYETICAKLQSESRSWLVTGAAGFIGSHLVEELLHLGQMVRGVDNFANGRASNLDALKRAVPAEAWARFSFVEGTITDSEFSRAACDGVELVLHQAALGSVPRSLANPLASHQANVDGFLNMVLAARAAGVSRFVFASSSSVYGDHPELPRRESRTGNPLSPYALTKKINEDYAAVFARCFGYPTIGLRYFNVFGPRQDPDGEYSAVIPRWIAGLIRGEAPTIFGDGLTSRDFCYVANAVQANLLAATTENRDALNQNYNVAVGQRATLLELADLLQKGLVELRSGFVPLEVRFREFRPGDVAHSHANIEKAARLLGYRATHTLAEGIRECLPAYLAELEALNPLHPGGAPAGGDGAGGPGKEGSCSAC